MRHETFLQEAALTALHGTAERTVGRLLVLAGALAVLSATGATLLVATNVLGLTPAAVLTITLTVLLGGGFAAAAVVALSARRIGRVASQPVRTLLGYLASTDEPLPDDLHFLGGRALTQAEVDADLRLLDKRMRSAARRSRLTIADLHKAREQANAQNMAKSRFLAAMSHDLRTPLSAILGYAMLLQEDARDTGNTSTIADLDNIQQAGRNLLTLINDILDLSRIEAGKTVVESEAIDIAAFTRSVAVAACGEAQRNGNRFALSVPDDVGSFVSDGAKIRQCLTNLLGNAFKFTEHGDVSLTVERNADGAFPAIHFTVRDTGIGIDPDHMEGLFQAFEKADTGFKRRTGGTGLGLAITRRLARMMGGDCLAESVRGAGSTFRLILPQGQVAVSSPPPLPAEWIA